MRHYLKKLKKTLYILAYNLKNALNGDKSIGARSSLFKGEEEGRIIKMIERVREYMGVVETSPNFRFVIPDDEIWKNSLFH